MARGLYATRRPSVRLSVANRSYVRLVWKLPNQLITCDDILIKFLWSTWDIFDTICEIFHLNYFKKTRKPSYCWQTRATRKRAKNCSNSTCLQRCRWQYWPIFIRLAVVASEICEIHWKIKLMEFKVIQGHRSWCQSKAHVRLPISH